jgi:outer membrane protein insertion porin family
LDPAALRTVLRVRSGDLFVPEKLEQDREALIRYYFERGFPRAEVETSWREAADPSQRVVVHRIRENARKRIGQIALRGNFKTEDWILFQELQLREGDLLTAEAAQVAQANLRQSGLFSGVQLRYFGVEDSRRETVDLIVRVDERHDNTAAIEAGGGWSTDSSFFVEAIGRMENIAGLGARLDTRAQAGFEIQAAESKLVFPRWLLRRATGRPFLLEVAGFWRNETTERFGDLESFGGSIAATREWRRGFFRNWFLSLRYSFRQRNRDQDLTRPPGASGDLTAVPVRTRTSSVGPHLVIDKRRDEQGRLNPLAPTRGYRLDLRTLFAEDRFLGSDRFIKLGGSLQHYVSLSDRLRLSNGFRYDHGIPLGGDVLLPEVERFFSGGDTTVRGFEEDRLATEIIESDVPPLGLRQFRVVPASGNIRFIHNLDLQLEVWELGPFPVATAVFLDSGFVTNSLFGFERRDLRHALGLSLFRYVTPFGSFSAEWAMPLNPRLGDDPRGRFHINVGATLQF